MEASLRKILTTGLVAAAAFCGASTARAADIDLYAPLHNFSLKESIAPPHGATPQPYSSTAPGAQWGIVSWSIPGGALPAFTKTTQGDTVTYTSRAAEAAVTITQAPGGKTSYTLEQDGRALPCMTDAGKPREGDLLLHPNSSENSMEASGVNHPRLRLPVSSLKKLLSEATITYSAVPVPGSCPVSSANALMGFILTNPTAKQTLFVYMSVSSSCGPQPAARQKFCEDRTNHPILTYFSRKQPFGSGYPLPLTGEPFIKSGETRHLSVDFVPPIMAVLKVAPPGMDREPSHWYVNSYGNGNNIYGKMKVVSTWSDVRVIAQTK